MSVCRICLKNTHDVRSIYDTDQGISYASMITYITNIKITENGYEVLCLLCVNNLRDLYDFKMLIEQSEVKMNINRKIFKFNTIDDIKDILLIDLHQSHSYKLSYDHQILFKNGQNSILYHNIFIKKIGCEQNGSLPVEDFLNTIKSKSYEDNDIDYFKEDTNKKQKYNQKKRLKKKKTKVKSNNICIKPVLLKDVQVIKACGQKKNKNKIKKNTYRSKEGICPYCGKRNKNMNQHLLLHTSERKFCCDNCSRSFYTKKNLEYHIKLHLRKPNFNCNNCIASFIDKGSLLRHMVIHTNVKEFLCEICNKAYKWKSGLMRHMLNHNISKKYKCDECNMSFTTNYSYKHHTRVHTGERPYKCELCSQPYSYKRDFNRHCFKKHGVIVDRRPVYVMNEEVLQRERSLMKDLVLRTNGIPTENEPLDSFKGPQRAKAFEQALTLLQKCAIPID